MTPSEKIITFIIMIAILLFIFFLNMEQEKIISKAKANGINFNIKN